MHSGIRIGVVGDFNHQSKAHEAISRALASRPERPIEAVWIPTDEVKSGDLAEFDGIWCAPGMPYRSDEGALQAIRHARLTRTPFLGTSAGFQYALLEYARNTLGLSAAEHQKTSPKAIMPLISPLACALAGVRARVRFMDGSKIRSAYGAPESVEEYHCSFGLNGRYRRLIEGGDLYVSAIDDQREIRGLELDGHPFFAATLFQPELRSLAEGGPPNPLVSAFVAACAERSRRAVSKAVG